MAQDTGKMPPRKPTVSLVLGSGGARGFAHIGVIHYLLEHGFEIRSIAGSSMGALVGGIYAAGKLDTYTQWVTALEKMDVIRLLDISFSGSGLFKGERIISVLRELIGERNIEDLPISFTAVATDIDAEKEVWLSDGPLFDAIRASIAIPSIVTPHEYKGRTFVDGGISNPIPIAPTLPDLTDITIAVNLSAKAEHPRPKPAKEISYPTNNYIRQSINKFVEEIHAHFGARNEDDLDIFDVISRSMDIMQNSIGRLKSAAYSPDYIIDIPSNTCTFYEFHRAQEIIQIGYRRAADTLSFLG
jgi:NTE family protein